VKAFHELVFDGRIEDGALHWCAAWPWQLAFGSVDTLKFFVAADSVEGVGPTLTLGIFESGDALHNNFAALPINGAPLNLGAHTTLTGAYVPADAGSPGSHWLGLACLLGGTDPKAHIRIWVTGRLN